jgi:hypothetical protein
MAQPLQSINLVAPAFKGINTEDSPIAQDPSFADVADNAVIDKRGRIAARKGFNLLTSGNPTGNDFIHAVHYFFDETTEEVFSAGNNKIFSGLSTLTDLTTPLSYTITDNDWKIVNFNDKAYFFQRGHEPLVYDTANGLRTFGTVNGYTTSTLMKCHEALSAYGRLWIADSDTESQIIHWSDLLRGNIFGPDAVNASPAVYPGSAGSIDVSKAWPDGQDEIVALSAHNGTLIVFGKHSILVYANAVSPTTMILADTIAGVGCIDRNSVQHIGTDVLFMSYSGLRSLGRVVQEKSLPLSDLSGTIKTELIEIINNNSSPVASVYSPENSFYLISFRDDNVTFCFDLKGALETGSFRVTRWPSSKFKCFERKKDGTLYVGTANGIGIYGGYDDNNESYRFRYYSPSLTFGDSSKTKFLKSLTPTVIGGNNATVVFKWAYDFSTSFSSQEITIGDQVPYYFSNPVDNTGTPIDAGGLADYSNPVDGNGDPIVTGGLAFFTGGTEISRQKVNATGSGTVITIGAEADINGDALSLQEINVLALIGRTI